MGCSSIGETSVNRSADATRSPPIQWSVETSTPSIDGVPLARRRCLPRAGRSGPNGMAVRSRPVKPVPRACPGPPKWFDTRREPDVPRRPAPRRHEVRRRESAAALIAPYVRRTPVLELEPGAFGVGGHAHAQARAPPAHGVVQAARRVQPDAHRGDRRERRPRRLRRELRAGGRLRGARASATRPKIFVPATSPGGEDRPDPRATARRCTWSTATTPRRTTACEERAWETGAAFLHPYDQPAVVAGQGTLALELSAQAPVLDTVIVAVGGAGLIGGDRGLVRRRRPRGRRGAVGVSDAVDARSRRASPSTSRWAASRPTRSGAARAGMIGLAIAARHVDRVVAGRRRRRSSARGRPCGTR